ncbi:unnamed protein product, partial [Symbiodinium microadriaticum]
NLLTHLVEIRRWTGPSVLLSPIPNSCDHIAAASRTWEEQWLDSMSILRRHEISPIVIGVGSSSDEQMLILDMMEEAGICGPLVRREFATSTGAWFQECPGWEIFIFPGDHGWKQDPTNSMHVAFLLDRVFRLREASVQRASPER